MFAFLCPKNNNKLSQFVSVTFIVTLSIATCRIEIHSDFMVIFDVFCELCETTNSILGKNYVSCFHQLSLQIIGTAGPKMSNT